MIKNYLKIITRNLFKNKIYTTINIIGFATGMAASILVFLYLDYEYTYDNFFDNYPRIYQLLRDYRIGNSQNLNPAMPYGLSPAIMESIPDIDASTRFFTRSTNVKVDDKVFSERVCFADTLLFKVFDYDFVLGSPVNALKDPNKIIVSESIANKYFGDQDPIGKSLLFDEMESFTIAGVIKDVPQNSHFRNKIIASMEYYKKRGVPEEEWHDNYFLTYVIVQPNKSLKKIEESVSKLYSDKAGNPVPTKFHLYTLRQMHLEEDQQSSSKKANLIIFLVIGVFILVIAGINYMNLSTSQYIQRTKEVGIRKVLGADRRKLIYQFFGESYLISIISLFIAIILVETALPLFNQIIGIKIDIDYSSTYLITLVFSIVIFSGLFAGSYPAFFLSSFKTVNILKKQVGTSRSNFNIRKYLVISQFTITIILLISTGIVFQQFNYLINTKNGFSIDNVVFLRLNQKISKNYDSFKSVILQNPSIKSISRVSGIPIDNYSLMNGIAWEGATGEKASSFSMNSVEPDFFKICEFEFTEGRPFSNDLPTDSACVIINEKAKNHMGFESPLNKTMQIMDDYKHKIIGVVKDFHALPLDAFGIEPSIFIIKKDFYSFILIRLDANNKQHSIEYIKSKWNEFSDGFPFSYRYLDDYKKELYSNTQETGESFSFFVIIALLISCAGLWGLTAFTMEQKTKEIGIRKTLGASSGNILKLLSNSFIRWVAISFIIACPIAYYFMDSWLRKFVYHREMSYAIFLISLALIVIIAQITVVYQTLKAARLNPVDCLRYE